MKIKWDKNAIDSITTAFTENARSLVKNEMSKRFTRQTGAEGKKFPKKTKGKYLWQTGQMVSSLKVRVVKNLVEWSLNNKSDIYENYLEYKTEWLTLDDELMDKLISNWAKNLKKKGF